MLSKKIIENLSFVNLVDYNNIGSVDLIIGGGGFFSYYVLGVERIIKKLEKEKKIEIKRYAGTSSGSISCVCMVCKVPSFKVLELYENIRGKKNYFDLLGKELEKILPEDAYLQCSGKVFISISHWTWFGLRNVIISEFFSNKDLISACLSSSCFPFFITNKLYYKFRNLYALDGCLTNNTEFFCECDRKIIIKPNNVLYYKYLMTSPFDDSIEGLVVKGAIEFEKFVRNEHHTFTSIQWYKKKSKIIYVVFFFGVCNILQNNKIIQKLFGVLR